MVHQRAGWVLRLAGLDERLADAIIDGLRRLTIDMAVDPHHPLRAKAEEGLAQLAVESAQRSRYAGPRSRSGRTRWSPTRRSATGSAASGRRAAPALLKGARDPDAALAGKFGEALRQLGETLQKEPRLARAINQFARRAAVGIVASYGERHRQAGVGDGARLGCRHRHRAARGARSAATFNISGSTAPSSAAWSASPSTRSKSSRERSGRCAPRNGGQSRLPAEQVAAPQARRRLRPLRPRRREDRQGGVRLRQEGPHRHRRGDRGLPARRRREGLEEFARRHESVEAFAGRGGAGKEESEKAGTEAEQACRPRGTAKGCRGDRRPAGVARLRGHRG